MTLCSAAVYSCHLVHGAYYGFLSTLVMAVGHLGNVVTAVKHALILFGSSVLFIIGFVPNLIYLVFMGLIKFFTYSYLSCSQTFNSVSLTAYHSAKTIAYSVMKFVCDVPIEAAVGVVVGVAIMIALKYVLFYMMENLILIPDLPIPSMLSMMRRRFIRWYVAIVREAHRRPLMENDTEEEELDDGDDANDENGNDNNDNVPDLNLPQNQAFAHQFNMPNNVAPIGFEAAGNQAGPPPLPIIPPGLARPPITRQRVRQLAQEASTQHSRHEIDMQPETSSESTKGSSSNGSNVDIQAYHLYRELEQERESQLCIVCQDKVKCVILLPCRHLCLCEACRSAIITRDNTCPVCRRPILESLRVFI